MAFLQSTYDAAADFGAGIARPSNAASVSRYGRGLSKLRSRREATCPPQNPETAAVFQSGIALRRSQTKRWKQIEGSAPVAQFRARWRCQVLAPSGKILQGCYRRRSESATNAVREIAKSSKQWRERRDLNPRPPA